MRFSNFEPFWKRKRSPAGGLAEMYDLENFATIPSVDAASIARIGKALFGLASTDLEAWPGIQAYLRFLRTQYDTYGNNWVHPAMESVRGEMPVFTFGDCITFISEISEAVKEFPSGSPVKELPNTSPSIDTVLKAWTQKYNKRFEDFAVEMQDTCRRAVFCALAWATLIVKVNPTPEQGRFDVIFPEGWGASKSSQRLDSSRRPTSALMRGFCQPQLLPSIETLNSVQSLHSSQDEVIYVSCVNHAMLHQFGKVTIEWTDVLSCHLLFLSSTRTLYLFRLPTICAMNLAREEGSNIFDSTMRGYFEETEFTARLWTRFKREVMLSYRILLGQDKASRKLFRIIKTRTNGDNTNTMDPLLEILCSKSTSSAEIAGLPSTLWPSSCVNLDGSLRKQEEYTMGDLPLLGYRLLKLQEFNLRQRPRTFWSFWKDTRDKPKWFTFWVVSIVGLVALVLAFVQIGLSAAQLAVSVKAAVKLAV